MDTNRIIADINTEISKLQQARAILASVGVEKGPGRPKSTEPKVTKPEKRKKPKKRKMSAKARATISAAMKARWTKARKTAKSSPTTASVD